MTPRPSATISTVRPGIILGLFSICALALAWRAVDLQLLTRDFLQEHADALHLRVVEIPAHRAMITDRNGEPLAISTPVKSIWANPGRLATQRERWPELARLLEMSVEQLDAVVTPRIGREFIYLKRHVTPDFAEQVLQAGIAGVTTRDEYRRYYPAGESIAHLIGFTNVDDEGQEGMELAYNQALRGNPGAKRVLRDRLGRVIEDIELLRPAVPGQPLALSIDRRLQYVAYRELKNAVQRNRARAGTVVVLDPRTGEVLAMVNQPSFNPNNRSGLKGEYYRNRAVTDVFEPGSTLKPFTIATALESGQFKAESLIATSPGFFRIGRHTVRDIHNYGSLTLTGILEKSSNVGAAKVALAMDAEVLWGTLSQLGFGRHLGTGFPGEAGGWLSDYRNLSEIEQATQAFGYGLSVTALHLARAWGALADDGVLHEASLVKRDGADAGTRVMSGATARSVRRMLVRAVEFGTGGLARVPGYQIAGKTGTVHKAIDNGYAEDRYLSLFAGMIPAAAPRLVAVIVIDEPHAGEHFGGRVAAPVFAGVMTDAVRILNIASDEVWPEAIDVEEIDAMEDILGTEPHPISREPSVMGRP
ncbi:MAG: penicillin-binding protein 2 [Gammaproteobacteria bacterium]|nr:penicillin-binding protein 2 [Gammaproteobacteria bacterium]